MYDVFLICKVRNATENDLQKQSDYVLNLESSNFRVYYPPRDTDQNDKIGNSICTKNYQSMKTSKMVHIYIPDDEILSEGMLFDFGMAFALNKKIVLTNVKSLMLSGQKSFLNVMKCEHTQVE